MARLESEEDYPWNTPKMDQEALLLRVYKLYDIENSGATEHSALVIALKELGVRSCLYTARRVLKAIDLAQLGRIDLNEFRSFFEKSSNYEEVKDLLSKDELKYINYKENAVSGDASFTAKYKIPECLSPFTSFENHRDVVQAVSWLGDEEFFSASLDGSVAVWHLNERSPMRVFRPTGASIYTSKRLGGDRDAIFGYAESRTPLNLVDLESSEVKINYTGLSGLAVTSLDSDGQTVLSGTKQGLCFSHAVDREEKVSTLTESRCSFESVSLKGSRAAVGDHEGHVTLIDLRDTTGIGKTSFEGALGKVSKVLFGSSDFELFVGGDDFVVRCFDLRNVSYLGSAISCYLGHSSPITSLEIDSDKTLLSGALDGSVRLWSLEESAGSTAVRFCEPEDAEKDGSRIATSALIGHSQAVKCIAARPGHVLTASSDTTVNHYRIN